MIIVRSPLRISLGGGGTDLPTYYRQHYGFVLSAAIDKYIYVSVNHSFSRRIFLKYANLEEVDVVDDIKHPAIRAALRLKGITDSFDLANLSDVPAGTGLGSSGSFTVALLKALDMYTGNFGVSRTDLAEEAYHLERDTLGQPVGKQDHYISAVGGITSFYFQKGDSVLVEPQSYSPATFYGLQDNLLLFFTGYSRSASDILRNQDVLSAKADKGMIENLHTIKELGLMSYTALRNDDLDQFAKLMDQHWARKKEREGMSNSHINELYELGRANGALGGKLVGAGGGGFLMFFAHDAKRLRATMAEAGLRELPFKFDFGGTKVIQS